MLFLAASLRKLGKEVALIDCLDRHHPRLKGAVPTRQDGTGKYLRELLPKPAPLRSIARNYARYGMPMQLFHSSLAGLPFTPDAVFVTSMMTYWYPAVRDCIAEVRKSLPGIPVYLGGVYATLCPEHAARVCGADHVCQGWPDVKALAGRFMDGQCAGTGASGIPRAAYDLYPELRSIALLTSLGCPHRCSYCASHLLTPFRFRRSPDEVFREIRYWQTEKSIEHVAFYDDALLEDAETGFKPLLRLIAGSGLDLDLHTPNGLSANAIDPELADLMFRARVRTVRLSYDFKVVRADFESALDNLQSAGYLRRAIGVYLLMGRPGQTVESLEESVRYLHGLGVRVHLASYSPIPGTRECKESVRRGLWDSGADPLLSNNSIYPLWRGSYGYSRCEQIRQWTRELNEVL